MAHPWAAAVSTMVECDHVTTLGQGLEARSPVERARGAEPVKKQHRSTSVAGPDSADERVGAIVQLYGPSRWHHPTRDDADLAGHRVARTIASTTAAATTGNRTIADQVRTIALGMGTPGGGGGNTKALP